MEEKSKDIKLVALSDTITSDIPCRDKIFVNVSIVSLELVDLTIYTSIYLVRAFLAKRQGQFSLKKLSVCYADHGFNGMGTVTSLVADSVRTD